MLLYIAPQHKHLFSINPLKIKIWFHNFQMKNLSQSHANSDAKKGSFMVLKGFFWCFFSSANQMLQLSANAIFIGSAS